MELFTAWLGANSTLVVNIEATYWLGAIRATYKFPRDLLVRFPQWQVKAKNIESFLDQPKVIIEGSQISIFSDLSLVMLKKHKDLKFLTAELRKKGISCQWGSLLN